MPAGVAGVPRQEPQQVRRKVAAFGGWKSRARSFSRTPGIWAQTRHDAFVVMSFPHGFMCTQRLLLEIYEAGIGRRKHPEELRILLWHTHTHIYIYIYSSGSKMWKVDLCGTARIWTSSSDP